MRNLRTAAAALYLTVCVGCWTVPDAAAQEMTPAQVDSVVWYAEQLEHDLAICKIQSDAVTDSLRVDLTVASMRIDLLKGNQRKWYHAPVLWYSIGVAVGVLAAK